MGAYSAELGVTVVLAVDTSGWIQAGASIVASFATLAAVLIAYRALRVSRSALDASNRGLALAEESVNAQFRVQFGAQLLAYGVVGDARGGIGMFEEPARLDLVVRNVGNELATRIVVSLRDREEGILLSSDATPIGESRGALSGRGTPAENEWELSFLLPKTEVFVGRMDPDFLFFSPYGVAVDPEMSRLKTTRIFQTFEEEYAGAVSAYEAAGEPIGAEVEDAAESNLHLAPGVSLVCSYSDALGHQELVIPEPDWEFDPYFSPWEDLDEEDG